MIDVADGLTPRSRAGLLVPDEMTTSLAYARQSSRIVEATARRWVGNDAPAAISRDLVATAQPFRTRYPLVEVQGDLGSTDGAPPADRRATCAAAAEHRDARRTDLV